MLAAGVHIAGLSRAAYRVLSCAQVHFGWAQMARWCTLMGMSRWTKLA